MHPEPTGPAEPPPHTVVPPARKGRLPVVVAAVVGLVIGGGGVGLGWILSSRGGSSDDIATVCDIVTGLGPMRDIGTDAGVIQQHRLGAASELSVAASTTDPRYKQLSDLLQKAMTAISRTFKADNPTTAQALRQSTDYCESR